MGPQSQPDHRVFVKSPHPTTGASREDNHFTQTHWRDMLQAMAVGVYTLDAEGRITQFNGQAVRIWGRVPDIQSPSAERISGSPRLYTPDGALIPLEHSAIANALRGEPAPQTEMLVERPDGSRIAILVAPAAVRDVHGRVVGVIVCLTDITEHKRAERLVRSLADAGAILTESLDYEQTLQKVAMLLVPRWADWCAIHLLNDDGELVNVGMAHADQSQMRAALALRRHHPLQNSSIGPSRVVRTGKPECHPVVSDEMLRHIARDDVQLNLLRRLGLRSSLCVPLTARSRTFGTLTLASAENPYRFTERDIPHVMELAQRCALAVDNARLHQELQQFNETLEQRIAQRTAELHDRARQLQRMAIALTEAERIERQRLAQILHDDHQQMLVAARLQLDTLRTTAPSDLPNRVAYIGNILQQAIQNARSLSHRLQPPALDTDNLNEALRSMAPWSRQLYDLTLHVEGEELPLDDKDLQLLIIQCVSELILNVVKHAGTREVWLRTRLVDDGFELCVEDRGCGFDVARLQALDARLGMGHVTMRERLNIFGGTMHVRSRPGEGTCVTITLPRAAASAEPAAALPTGSTD